MYGYISLLIDIIHLVYILLPIGIYFIPNKYFWLTKIIILFLLLTPLHWQFFNDKCILSKISMLFGGLEKAEHESPFTEKYLFWIIKPIFNLLNLELNFPTISKAIYFQWGINYLVIYYYIFYYLKCTIR
tara:strand:+ start:810 stop:1199 length:390 start_codon:yes stop_codon:yes gene_type:complete